MIILIGSKIGQTDIQASLGKPEYSYFFLLREFLPALRRLGTVIEASDPDEVDRLYARYRDEGQPVVFLSFSPPQQTPVGLRCPTVCAFAWEFDNLPDEPWENDPRNDWRYVFERIAAAVPCSQETADAVRRAMGDGFPVLALPAPVWSRFAEVCPPGHWTPCPGPRVLDFHGNAIDSPILGLSADGLVRKPAPEAEPIPMPEPPPEPEPEPETPPPAPLSVAEKRHVSRVLLRDWWNEVRGIRPEPPPAPVPESLPEPEPEPVVALEPVPQPEPAEPPPPPPPYMIPQAHRLELNGVVYTTVLNPGDGRKNWVDLITAFCWAFKDTEDATLVVKMTHHDLEYYRIVLLTLLSRLAPFRCRVLVLHGFLDDAQYRALVEATDYYVNASACEGLCLPLMEFLSAGKPALAPRHTAMLDYLDPALGFVVDTRPEPSCWSHDPTGKLRTRRHRLNWESLMRAYRESHRQARENPEAYRAMSAEAFARMRDYCAVERVAERLGTFLDDVLARAADRRDTPAESPLP